MCRLRCQRKNLPNRRHHKASGQAFVILLCHVGVRICHYLGKYNSPEFQSEYDRLIGIYTANGRKLPPPEKESAPYTSCFSDIPVVEWASSWSVASFQYGREEDEAV